MTNRQIGAAFLVMGLVMLAAAAIVRTVELPVNAETTIANALPMASTEPVILQPSAVPFTVDPPVRFMTAEEEAAFQNHEWLAVAYDRGTKNVYGGAWFACRHIDPHTLTFNTVRTDPSLSIWNELTPAEQTEIVKECGNE